MEDNIVNTTKIDVRLEDISAICNLVFKRLDIINPIFNITILNDNEIKEINKKYRGIDSATDVISFAFEEESNIKYTNTRVLGDIYISIEKAISQAKEYGHDIKRELCFLTVHGLLHLLGYDHINEEDRKVMRTLEESVLEEYDAKR